MRVGQPAACREGVDLPAADCMERDDAFMQAGILCVKEGSGAGIACFFLLEIL